MPEQSPAAEVDHYLDQYWNSQRKMVRRIWIPIGLVLLFLFEPASWTPYYVLISLPILILYMLPNIRAMNKRIRRRMIVVLWLRRFHRGALSRNLLRLWQ